MLLAPPASIGANRAPKWAAAGQAKGGPRKRALQWRAMLAIVLIQYCQ